MRSTQVGLTSTTFRCFLLTRPLHLLSYQAVRRDQQACHSSPSRSSCPDNSRSDTDGSLTFLMSSFASPLSIVALLQHFFRSSFPLFLLLALRHPLLYSSIFASFVCRSSDLISSLPTLNSTFLFSIMSCFWCWLSLGLHRCNRSMKVV